MQRVALLVPSYRPFEFFTRLLPKLLEQIDNFPDSDNFTFEIFVSVPTFLNIDDYSESLSTNCLTLLRLDATGYSHPRNQLWDATKDFDIVVFIDDDQIPLTDWLRELISTIHARPEFTVFSADIHYFLLDHPLTHPYMNLMPRNRVGRGAEILGNELGIANTAIVRRNLDDLPKPFHIEFNAGGEDIYFFALLRSNGHRFYQVRGAAVMEQWELSRVEIRTLIERGRRGIEAYYKLRLYSLQKDWQTEHKPFVVYGRILPLVMISPFLLFFLAFISRCPSGVFRSRAYVFLAKIFFVSVIPWQLRIVNLTRKARHAFSRLLPRSE